MQWALRCFRCPFIYSPLPSVSFPACVRSPCAKLTSFCPFFLASFKIEQFRMDAHRSACITHNDRMWMNCDIGCVQARHKLLDAGDRGEYASTKKRIARRAKRVWGWVFPPHTLASNHSGVARWCVWLNRWLAIAIRVIIFHESFANELR